MASGSKENFLKSRTHGTSQCGILISWTSERNEEMDTIVTCNKCKKDFGIGKIDTIEIEKGLQVQEFSCPTCGARYLISITDATLRGLIKERIALTNRQRAAMKKRLREKTLRKYMHEMDQLTKKIQHNQNELKAMNKEKLKEYENM